MQEQLPVRQNQYDPEQIALLKRTMCTESSDDEFSLFLNQCKRTGLDPFLRQICAVFRWDSRKRRKVMTIQTTVDGLRMIAERTGKYSGQEGPFWCGSDGEWKDVWLVKTPPAAAKVGILRKDFLQPLCAVARFDAYAAHNRDGQLNSFWRDKGDIMIAKCAEALGLRKAFPFETSDLYAGEEMQQLESESEPSSKIRPKLMDVQEWENDVVPDPFIHRDWRGKGYTYRQLAADPGITCVCQDGRTLTARQYLYLRWQKEPINAECKRIYEILRIRYPSKTSLAEERGTERKGEKKNDGLE